MSETLRRLLVLLGVVNAFTLLLFGWDKLMARRRQRRVPEAALLGACLCGGAAGGLAGMLLFRHKIRKVRFQVAVPLLLLLQSALAVWTWVRFPA